MFVFWFETIENKSKNFFLKKVATCNKNGRKKKQEQTQIVYKRIKTRLVKNKNQ
jgi:hypothetical protein